MARDAAEKDNCESPGQRQAHEEGNGEQPYYLKPYSSVYSVTTRQNETGVYSPQIALSRSDVKLSPKST